MKTELKAKFLQHLAMQRKDSGFTLIELLVVIVIIGILAAIALPSFLNQANKARQTEAKTYVGSMNRAQQAYFVEFGAFGTDAQLEGAVQDTSNFDYTITPNNGAPPTAIVTAAAKKANLKSYAGLVVADANQTPALVCETTATATTIANPSYTAGAAGVIGTLNCGAGSAEIAR